MILIRSILLVVMCLSFIGSAWAQQAQWDKLGIEAMELYRQGKFTEGKKVNASIGGCGENLWPYAS